MPTIAQPCKETQNRDDGVEHVDHIIELLATELLKVEPCADGAKCLWASNDRRGIHSALEPRVKGPERNLPNPYRQNAGSSGAKRKAPRLHVVVEAGMWG